MQSDRNLLLKIDKQQQLINSNRPFTNENILNLKEYYRVGLTHSSNALEGNTLTLSETKVVLEDGITIGGKPLKDHLEAIGHGRAFDFMWNLAQNNKTITESDIKTLHKYCVEPENPEIAGKYRMQSIYISGTEHNDKIPTADEVPGKMKEWAISLEKRRLVLHPVDFAIQVHKELVQIHPFKDGNGRTARLLMNLTLRQDGYPIVIIPSAVRHEYIQVLENAWTNDQDFTRFIYERVDEAQRELIRNLHLTPQNQA
ncbi:Hypothetical protein LUCI_2486 [Lucifera butyrica]|uniref:Fido domain-containing protein n=1 Tax=Lucifera butyrica TaxID=1351585 RepID=A0A498RAC5_9FIRM|nr:Fic family protein [Lucifera butyrica]VBB07242.1 Hypothetical protein LUCI_2486 [Lucifera butyrica]